MPRRLAAMPSAPIATDHTTAERDVAAVLTRCALGTGEDGLFVYARKEAT